MHSVHGNARCAQFLKIIWTVFCALYGKSNLVLYFWNGTMSGIIIIIIYKKMKYVTPENKPFYVQNHQRKYVKIKVYSKQT